MKVVIISGATATGKTSLAIDFARRFGGEVVNFDSLLLYREINIGTAKPSAEEIKEVPHHMINVASVGHPLNASDYAKEALPIIEKLHKENKIVYLVGGSGFYLQALLKGMYDSPTTPTEVLKRSDELYQNEGIIPFLEILKQHDPESFERYHANDHYRIRRAVEHFWAHHTPLSSVRLKKEMENQSLDQDSVHGWEVIHFYLNIPKPDHLKIIEKRTNMMLAQGLIGEVKSLLEDGFQGDERPLQSIGYKETIDYLRGDIKSESEWREKIIISTRQLAKSQRTWFNRIDRKLTFNPLTDRETIFLALQNFLQK